MGNGGDGRQAAERPPGEGGVRLRVRDRLGFLIYIYITHIGLGLLHLGSALLVSGGCGCTRGSILGSAPAPIRSKTRGCPHPRVQLPSLILPRHLNVRAVQAIVVAVLSPRQLHDQPSSEL